MVFFQILLILVMVIKSTKTFCLLHCLKEHIITVCPTKLALGFKNLLKMYLQRNIFKKLTRVIKKSDFYVYIHAIKVKIPRDTLD